MMAEMDALKEAVGYDDDAIELLYAATGYGSLLDTMSKMASHAAAAGDDPTRSYGDPDWYNRLCEQRHARFEAEV